MKVTVDLRVPTWLKRPATWRVRGAIVAVALLAVGVPVAWASHQFADVPNDQQFHAQIDAIADAGITTGCGGGNYCPNDFVRRDAMAAFMHRGFGRVGKASLSDSSLETSDTAAATVGTITLTPGLPAGALAGANGFIEATAHINIRAGASGCPCEYWAAIFDTTEGAYFNSIYAGVLVSNDELDHMTVTGAIPADVVGSHTIQVRVFRQTGTATTTSALGDFIASYVPFGSEGGDILSTGSGPAATGPQSTPG